MGSAQVHPQPPRWREVFSGSLGRLTFGLFLLEVMSAVQVLVVATVLPTVTKDLAGLRLYGWAFSASGLAIVMAIPLAGQAVDRVGPSRPLALSLVSFAAGTLLVGLAPTMPLFVVGRFIQGAAGGTQAAVGLGTVAKTYPENHRPRVLALLAAAWVLPGLLGPSYGALMASTIGWRWAFLLLLPLVPPAAWLVFPGLARLPRPEKTRTALDVRKPAALAVGSAAVLLGLTSLSPWSVPLVMLGGLLAGVALRGLLAGSARGRAGFGAALLAGFLLSLAFFGVDGFVPLLLTRIRGRTLAEASVVVTLATVGWSAGSLWQSQVVARRSKPALIVGGAVAIAVGAIGVAAGLLRTPLALPYAAWTVAGLGMGVAYPTIYLAMMERATPGSEGAAVALLLLLDSLGVSAGTGLGGSAVAIVEAMDVSLRVGLAVAFGLALCAALALMPLATRLRD